MAKKNLIDVFWTNVRRYQALMQLSDLEIAKALKIDIASWRNYRRTKANASLSRVAELAEILKVEPFDLLEYWTATEWNKAFGKRKE